MAIDAAQLEAERAAAAQIQKDLDAERSANQRNTIRLAKLEAKQEFPMADMELLELFQSTDVTQIKEFAKRSHEKAAAAVPPPPPPQAPPAPPIMPNPNDVPEPQAISEARQKELLQKAELRTATPAEREEFIDNSLKGYWNTFVQGVRQLARTS